MVVPAVLISTILGALNGYVLTKWRFRGHTLVFGLMLFACFIPVPVGASADGDHPRQPRPLRVTLQNATGFRFGFGNPTVNLVFVHVVYGLGFTTLFFRNFYEAFPTELVKAAQVDGAGFFQIFRRIMLPNSLPIIVVTVIYQFTNIWNDFLFASAYAGTGESMPMTVALNNVVNTSTGVVEYNVNMAAAMIAATAHASRLHSRRPLFRARTDGGRRQRIIPWLSRNIRPEKALRFSKSSRDRP
jgi:glucose/mannose transport system permease protein